MRRTRPTRWLPSAAELPAIVGLALPLLGSAPMFSPLSGVVHHPARADGGVHAGRAHAAGYGAPLPLAAVVPAPDPAVAAVSAAALPANDPETALASLSVHVRRTSHPTALRVAFEAYFRYRETQPGVVRKPYLYFVDLGLDNRTARGWVFDMDRLELVEGPFPVAHGSGSSATRDAVPTVFSNRRGSRASSLGLYVARELYDFRGRAGGRAYTSMGLRLRGESGPFNDAAERRGIVVHGAPYVTPSGAGRSEGCPAMEPARAKRLLPLLAEGGVVFLYSPRDEAWLRTGPWVRSAGGGAARR